MANIIRIKRRTSGSSGAPPSLYNAELAFNEVDKVLYYGFGTGGVGGTAGTIIPIGGEGAFLSLSGNSAVTISREFTFGSTVSLGSQATATTGLYSDNSTRIATTEFVKNQGYLTANQTINVYGDVTGSGTTSITTTLANSGVTAGTYSKVTVNAKGLVTVGGSIVESDIPTLSSAKISDFDSAVRNSRLDQMGSPTNAVTLNSQKITNLADPSNSQDAATKAYVDSTSQGLDPKQSVRVATQADVTISAPGSSIDGVSLSSGDRVLVKTQTTSAQNGIYVFNGASSAMTRALDANTEAKLNGGAFFFVEDGTDAANGYVLQKPTGSYTLGSTALSFAQFSGAGQIAAGAGLTKSANTLNVVGTSSRITVNADSVDIAATYVGQTSITTLGTISTGNWNGTVIDVAYGGTGTTTLTGYLKGNGTSAFTGISTIPGSDINGDIAGKAANVTGTVAVSNGGTGATSLTGILKGNGTSALSAASAGTDYLDPSSTVDGGTF